MKSERPSVPAGHNQYRYAPPVSTAESLPDPRMGDQRGTGVGAALEPNERALRLESVLSSALFGGAGSGPRAGGSHPHAGGGGAIPASVSTAADGSTTFKYGELSISTQFNDSKPMPFALVYKDWQYFSSCEPMRAASAAWMGQPPPPGITHEVQGQAPNSPITEAVREGKTSDDKTVAYKAGLAVQESYFGMKAVAEGEKSERVSYRGIAVPAGTDILGARTGSTMDLPLSSFTPDRATADMFSAQVGEGTPVTICLAEGSRIAKSPPDAEVPGGKGIVDVAGPNGTTVKDSWEYVSQGHFTITGCTTTGTTRSTSVRTGCTTRRTGSKPRPLPVSGGRSLPRHTRARSSRTCGRRWVRGRGNPPRTRTR